MGLAFQTGELSLEVVSCPRFDMAPDTVRSLARKRTFEEMAARICRKAHDIEQTQKVIPLIARETSFGQNVRELVFGVNIFDLDLGFQVDPVKQPVKSNSVGSGHVSDRWTSSFGYHFDHSFIVFKNVKLRLVVRRMCVCGT